jgi:hypothetical protein
VLALTSEILSLYLHLSTKCISQIKHMLDLFIAYKYKRVLSSSTYFLVCFLYVNTQNENIYCILRVFFSFLKLEIFITWVLQQIKKIRLYERTKPIIHQNLLILHKNTEKKNLKAKMITIL